jgi:3-oxoadipate enol-lactonase
MGIPPADWPHRPCSFARGVDGIDISYVDLGPRKGRTVVLCHGLGAGGELFAADAAYFASRGYRVLVPDLRGHGASGTPPGHADDAFTIERMAADLIAMLDDAGLDEVDWVGNSLGGILALALLGSAPHRFRTFATFGTTYTPSLPRATARAFPLTYGLFGRRLTAAVAAQVTTCNNEARPLIAKMLRQFDPHVGEAVVKNVACYDFIVNAQAFPRPVLLLRGGRDHRVNAGLRPTLAAMQGRPNFTFVKLRGGGHCANLDATEAWRSTLVEFWQSAEPFA